MATTSELPKLIKKACVLCGMDSTPAVTRNVAKLVQRFRAIWSGTDADLVAETVFAMACLPAQQDKAEKNTIGARLSRMRLRKLAVAFSAAVPFKLTERQTIHLIVRFADALNAT